MTRDELIEAVARSILYERYFAPDYDSYKDEKEFWENLDEDHMHDAKSEAEAAIDTIFAALKEPTGESLCAGSKSDVLSSAIIDWQGNYVSEEEVASDVWGLMLSASPLAPREK